MDSSSDKLVNVAVTSVFFLVIVVLLHSTAGRAGLVGLLVVLAPAIELGGVLVAAFPDVEILGTRSPGARRIEQIHNAIQSLSERGDEIEDCPVIDDSVAGFDEVATQMQRELRIDYPESIRSTPTVGTYVIDGDDVENFSMSSMIKKALEIERKEKERFQSLGLQVLAFGLAVQLLSSILRTLHSPS